MSSPRILHSVLSLRREFSVSPNIPKLRRPPQNKHLNRETGWACVSEASPQSIMVYSVPHKNSGIQGGKSTRASHRGKLKICFIDSRFFAHLTTLWSLFSLLQCRLSRRCEDIRRIGHKREQCQYMHYKSLPKMTVKAQWFIYTKIGSIINGFLLIFSNAVKKITSHGAFNPWNHMLLFIKNKFSICVE